MLNDSELATLRNRFKRDAEFLMQTTTSPDEDGKSKLHKQYISSYYYPTLTSCQAELNGNREFWINILDVVTPEGTVIHTGV